MKSFTYQLLLTLSAFIRALNSSIWNLKLSKVDNIKIFENCSILLTRYGDIARNLYGIQHMVRYNKGFEYETLSKYKSVVFEGATVLDIGANVGLFSIFGSKLVGENGRILAFEPSNKTFQALLENIKLNNSTNVKVYPFALSDSEGTVNIGSEGFGDAYNHMKFDDKNVEETVTMRRLDLLLEEEHIVNVDVIKIDVEGAEYLTFKGAEDFFKKEKLPIIIMECYEPWCRRFDKSVFDVLNYLSQFGYTFEQYEDYQWIAIPNNKVFESKK